MSAQATGAPILGNLNRAGLTSENRRWSFPRRLSRPVKLLVAAVLLTALYTATDWRAVGAALLSLDGAYLALAFSLFVPQTLLSAWRWKCLVRHLRRISLGQALRHTLAANALNLVVPSKLGDFSKAAMLPESDSRVRRQGTMLAALEKGVDVAALASLLVWGWFGWEAAPLACVIVALAALAGLFWRRGGWQFGAAALAAASVALWTLHLWQIDLFLKAAGVHVAWSGTLARVPVAIFAGLAPVSFCGVGTRDSALVWMFADVASASAMAAVGLLTASRYLVPGAIGIPFLTLGGKRR